MTLDVSDEWEFMTCFSFLRNAIMTVELPTAQIHVFIQCLCEWAHEDWWFLKYTRFLRGFQDTGVHWNRVGQDQFDLLSQLLRHVVCSAGWLVGLMVQPVTAHCVVPGLRLRPSLGLLAAPSTRSHTQQPGDQQGSWLARALKVTWLTWPAEQVTDLKACIPQTYLLGCSLIFQCRNPVQPQPTATDLLIQLQLQL